MSTGASGRTTAQRTRALGVVVAQLVAADTSLKGHGKVGVSCSLSRKGRSVSGSVTVECNRRRAI